MKYTNNHNVDLFAAAWLAHDSYDHNDDPYTISVTTLLRPVKQVILASRVPPSEAKEDIIGLIKSRMGTAIHDSFESVWLDEDKWKPALAELGYPKRVIDRMKVNPSDEELADNPKMLPVYTELRASRKVGKWTVSGKYDFVVDGQVEDLKNTSTFSFTKGNRIEDFQKQGSMYRWLNPKQITKDHVRIHYVFWDWTQSQSYQQGYPEGPYVSRLYELASVADTEHFVRTRLNTLEKLWHADESQMEPCTNDELWVDPPVYKYYANPEKKSRATRNFDNMGEAQAYRAGKGKGKGVIDLVYGEVKACRYCAAAPICKQKDEYIASGRLKM